MASLGDLFKLTSQEWLRSAAPEADPLGNMPADMNARVLQQMGQPPGPPQMSPQVPAPQDPGAIYSPLEQEKAAFAAEVAPRPEDAQSGINPWQNSGLYDLIKRGHRIVNAPIPGADPMVPTMAAGMEGVMLTEVAPRLLGRTAGGGMDEMKVPGARPRGSAISEAPLPRPRQPRESTKPAPPFYSRLRRLVENPKTQGKQTGEQWLKFLGDPKRRVKSDELKWTGVREYLEGRKGQRVTRDEILEHLAANEIQVVEVTKGGEYDWSRHENRQDNAARERFGREFDSLEGPQRREIREIVGEGPSPTKFSQYTIGQGSGAENYREVLLRLPENTRVDPALDARVQAAEKAYSAAVAEFKAVSEPLLDGLRYMKIERQRHQERGSAAPQELVNRMRAAEDKIKAAQLKKYDAHQELERHTEAARPDPGFPSGHWDEPNVLVHLRLSDRKTPDGKKTLVLEEIQSDWGQKGRKEGFALPSEQTAPMDAEYRRLVHRNAAAREAGREPNPTDIRRAQELEAALEQSDRSKIPEAPFVGKTSDWTKLGLKRVLKMAADEGYERVGIVRGKESAAHYNLAKQVDEIQYRKLSGDRYQLMVKRGGRSILEDSYSANKLEDVVGKEVADRIVKGEGVRRGDSGILRGLDLEVGGEGMKKFYDEIVPQELNKLGKEYGIKVELEGARVRSSSSKFRVDGYDDIWVVYDVNGDALMNPKTDEPFNSKREAEAYRSKLLDDEGTPVHSLGLPEAARERIKREGFPIISSLRPGTTLGDVLRRRA